MLPLLPCMLSCIHYPVGESEPDGDDLRKKCYQNAPHINLVTVDPRPEETSTEHRGPMQYSKDYTAQHVHL